MVKKKLLAPVESIGQTILFVRESKVILDIDLARLFGTTTKRLNEQVRRNIERFPDDFMFQLAPEEYSELKKHDSRYESSAGRGGRRYPPFAFTEHGAIMAAGLINTPIAIEVSIFVVRAFVRLRHLMATHDDLARKLDTLEKKYDIQFSAVFDAIRQLMEPPKPKKKPVGFHWDEDLLATTKGKTTKKRAPAKKTPADKTGNVSAP